jgi:hypothetical protein
MRLMSAERVGSGARLRGLVIPFLDASGPGNFRRRPRRIVARFIDPDYRKPMAIADMLGALRS